MSERTSRGGTPLYTISAPRTPALVPSCFNPRITGRYQNVSTQFVGVFGGRRLLSIKRHDMVTVTFPSPLSFQKYHSQSHRNSMELVGIPVSFCLLVTTWSHLRTASLFDWGISRVRVAGYDGSIQFSLSLEILDEFFNENHTKFLVEFPKLSIEARFFKVKFPVEIFRLCLKCGTEYSNDITKH